MQVNVSWPGTSRARFARCRSCQNEGSILAGRSPCAAQ
jgi:hypothetical protein